MFWLFIFLINFSSEKWYIFSSSKIGYQNSWIGMTNLTGQRLYWSFPVILPRKIDCHISVYAHLLPRYLLENQWCLCAREWMRIWDTKSYFKILVRRAGLCISGIILNLIFTSLFSQERNKGKDGRERRRKEKSENISRFSSTSMWVLW